MNTYFIRNIERNTCAGSFVSTSKRAALQTFEHQILKRWQTSYPAIAGYTEDYDAINLEEAIKAGIVFAEIPAQV